MFGGMHTQQTNCNNQRQRKSVVMKSLAVLAAYGGVEPVVMEFLADSRQCSECVAIADTCVCVCVRACVRVCVCVWSCVRLRNLGRIPCVFAHIECCIKPGLHGHRCARNCGCVCVWLHKHVSI